MRLRPLAIGAAAVVGLGLTGVSVFLRLPGSEAAPAYGPSDLPPAPAREANGWFALDAAADYVARPDFDWDLVEATSWSALKAQRPAVLGLDFDEAAWATAERLDRALTPHEHFTEPPGTGDATLRMLSRLEILLVRVLVLTNRGEVDEATSLLFRLRAVTTQWVRDARTLLGGISALTLRQRLEATTELLARESPLREALRADAASVCAEPLAAPSLRSGLVTESLEWHRGIADLLEAKGLRSRYAMMDLGECQRMVDGCVALLIEQPEAECPLAGLDGWPDWFHNRLGRRLAGSQNVVMMNAVRAQLEALAELERARARLHAELGCSGSAVQ